MRLINIQDYASQIGLYRRNPDNSYVSIKNKYGLDYNASYSGRYDKIIKYDLTKDHDSVYFIDRLFQRFLKCT